jgi:tetratricopeptide (TPR) repeat protein
LFRLVALVGLPAILLGGLELGLRVAGYGYATSFFLRTRLEGREVLVENADFGRRFFPAALSRSPPPLVLDARKPPGVYRVFVFGESAALGDPRPAYGVSRYVEALLRDRFPQGKFEVVCVAMTAINSHAILPIAKECARLQGDAWIVYMGNNEMAGPFGANTVFGPRAPSRFFIRASLALKRTRLGQLLGEASQRLRERRTGAQEWGGLKMFLRSELPPDAADRTKAHENFRRNLEEILCLGAGAGAKVVVCTVASNLKDCAPFASRHRTGLNKQEAAEWNQQYGLAVAWDQQGNTTNALAGYEAAAKVDSQFAELQFLTALCADKQGNSAKAQRAYGLARDYDALPFRADSKLNSIIAEMGGAQTRQGVAVLDAVEVLAKRSPGNVPGSNLFFDQVHFNFRGNYFLAVALAERLAGFLPPSLTTGARDAWASEETCHGRLGLTDWNRYSVLEGVLLRLADAPYTNQLNHLSRQRALATQLAELKARLVPGRHLDALFIYNEALKLAPRDHWLRANLAEFLEATGNLTDATAEWEKVRELLPHHHAAWYQAGRLLARQKKYVQARECLGKALALRPDLAEGYLELGRTFYEQGEPARALEQYATAKRLRVEDPRVYLHSADALAALNRRAEAVENLREAVRLRPAYWEARYLLGVELAMAGEVQLAQEQFEEVLRLRPSYALGHLNLGVALAKQRRLREALFHFQETLRLDPGNSQAREHIETIQKLVNRPAAQ